jgi:tetratricopeptide (TPR) repeat protein
MYRQAIAIDPNFALAYAGLADAYNVTVSGLPPATRFPLARAAAERALALDPRSAEAHNALAFLLYKFEWKWQDSEREFRRAIALDPNYALAHHWFGEYLGLLRRYPESIEQFRQALALDPLSVAVRVDFLDPLVAAGRIGEARAVLDEGMRIDRMNPRLLIASSAVLAAEGHEAEGVDAELRGRLLLGAPETEVDALGAAYRRGGMRAFDEERVALLLEQVKRGALSVPGMSAATQLGLVYAKLHDREHALEWLTRSVDRGEDGALHLRVPVYDFLRDDPQYQALAARVGIP